MYERVYLSQRAFAVCTRLKVLYRWQFKWKLIIWHSDHSAVRAMYYRDRLAPISLTIESPVFHLILNALFTAAQFFKNSKHLFDSFFLVCYAVKLTRVDHFAIACVGFLRNVTALDDFDYVNAELLCKIIVPCIVSRHSHDSACAVSHHNIV